MTIRVLLCVLISFLASFWGEPTASAYPNFIGFGYKSCVVCHYNPNGGGPLTDYGRATGATVIAAKPFYNSNISDDDLGKQSQFFGTAVKLPDAIRPAFNYRGLYYVNTTQAKSIHDWITMQAEGSLTLKSKSSQWIATGTLGYIPPPRGVPDAQKNTYKTLISREYYVSYRPSKYYDIEAGLMGQVFGINSPDHDDYFRSSTELNQADQTHAVQVHLAGKTWESVIQGQLGDLTQNSNIRQKGLSAIYEHDVFTDARIGASILATKSDFRTREMGAVHARVGLPEGSAILTELGFNREIYPNSPSVLREFLFLQPYVALNRGIFLFATFEYYSSDNYTQKPAIYSFGPGLQYFPVNRLELRIDYNSQKSTGQTAVAPQISTFLFQVHVWL